MANDDHLLVMTGKDSSKSKFPWQPANRGRIQGFSAHGWEPADVVSLHR